MANLRKLRKGAVGPAQGSSGPLAAPARPPSVPPLAEPPKASAAVAPPTVVEGQPPKAAFVAPSARPPARERVSEPPASVPAAAESTEPPAVRVPPALPMPVRAPAAPGAEESVSSVSLASSDLVSADSSSPPDLGWAAGGSPLDLGSVVSVDEPKTREERPLPATIRRDRECALARIGDIGFIMPGLKLSLLSIGPDDITLRLVGRGIEKEVTITRGVESSGEFETSKGPVSISLLYKGTSNDGSKIVQSCVEGSASVMNMLESRRIVGTVFSGGVSTFKKYVSEVLAGTFIAAISTAMVTVNWVGAELSSMKIPPALAAGGLAIVGAALVVSSAISRRNNYRREEQNE